MTTFRFSLPMIAFAIGLTITACSTSSTATPPSTAPTVAATPLALPSPPPTAHVAPFGASAGASFLPWDQKQCDAQIRKIKKLSAQCLEIKKTADRNTCAQGIAKKLPAGYDQGCHKTLETFFAAYQRQEEKLYPSP